MGLFRITTREVEFGGATIPANAREHLAFARGVHVCLGAPLARLELSIALERLLQRLPNLRPAPDASPQRLEHFWLRGYISLPIAWDAAA